MFQMNVPFTLNSILHFVFLFLSVVKVIHFFAAIGSHLHLFLCEANHGQSLHHHLPVVLVTDGADSGAVSLSKTRTGHTSVDVDVKPGVEVPSSVKVLHTFTRY